MGGTKPAQPKAPKGATPAKAPGMIRTKFLEKPAVNGSMPSGPRKGTNLNKCFI